MKRTDADYYVGAHRTPKIMLHAGHPRVKHD